jgi:superfamily II DNA or RNA helicase
MIILRAYQEKGIADIRAQFMRGSRHVCYVAPTGSGKTVLFIELVCRIRATRDQHVAIIVHRGELIDQTASALAAAGIEFGIIAAGHPEKDAPVLLCMAQTLANRLDRLVGVDFLIVDECFPAGTLIDGRPIETLRSGDTVASFDETTRRRTLARISRVSARRAYRLVRIRLADGSSIVSTPEHPFFTPSGWRHAATLTEGSEVYVDPVHRMRSRGDIPNQTEVGRLEGEGPSILLGYVPTGVGGEVQLCLYGSHQSQVCINADENAQSYEAARDPRQGREGIAGYGPPAADSGRQWAPHAETAGVAVGVTWPGVGGQAQSVAATGQALRLPLCLQVGYRPSGDENGDRNRRPRASSACSAYAGRQEGRVLLVARVVGVETVESGRDDEFERLCPGGVVYNLEVEDTHTFFANGVAVHNCHHSTAATWLAIINAAPKARLLGVSATPERLGGEGLNEVFDVLVVGPTVKELIANRWLSPFVAFVPERLISLKGLRSVGGDYAAGDLAKRMNVGYVLDDALAEYRKHLVDQTAICFSTTTAHSQDVAQFFRAAGIRAQHLDGDTPRAERQALIKALATGEVQIISNCDVLSEGLNTPSVGGVILLRPTKSLALHLQQIGRALRPAPGKRRAVILDHSGNCLRHGLPDLEHEWSLEGRPKKPGDALVRRCLECGAIISIAARSCPECGADLRPEPIKPVTMPDPLVELDPTTAHERWLAQGSFKDVSQWAGDDETRLSQVAKARNYKPGWVWHRLRTSREGLSP